VHTSHLAAPDAVRSVAVVAHPDDLAAVLATEPGRTDATLTLVTTSSVPALDHLGWVVRAQLAVDPRTSWAEVAELVACGVVDADLVVLIDGAHPEPGWLARLVAAFDEDEHLGVAQPLVVDAVGTTLVDAGTLVFRDGSTAAYGAGEVWPAAPPFSCRRHVDALSGHCAAVRREILAALDPSLVDHPDAATRGADLAFATRRAGARTLLEPAARVRAIGSARPAATDLAARWSVELSHQPAPVEHPFEHHALAHRPQGGFGPGEVLRHDWIGSRAVAAHARRIWMIDPCTLTWDRDTGHLRAFRIVEELRTQGHQVVYWADWGGLRDEYVPALSRLGVMSWGADTDVMRDHADPTGFAATFRPPIAELALRHPADLVWISFHHLVPRYLSELRTWLPDAPIVLDTVDVHHVREGREAEVLDDDDLRAKAQQTRRWELASCRAVDAVICVTDDDAAVLQTAIPDLDVHIVSVVNAVQDPGPGFADRAGAFFVASFVPTPNADALRWYRDEIKPRLDALCDERGVARIGLTVAGNDPGGRAKALAGPGIDVIGRVPEVLPHLHAARVSIAPLRWGAGIKGKVCEALAAGLPVVGTTVAFEGLEAVDGDHGLVADDADAFAEAIFRLHEDRALWERVRELAPPHVDDRVGLGRLRRSLGPVLDVRRRAHVVAPVPSIASGAGVPGRITVIVHCADDAAEAHACLLTLRHGMEGDVEVIVIDDGLVPALDPVALAPFCTEVLRTEDVGHRAAVVAGIARATGEHVVVLGSEALVGPGWASTVRRVLADPTVGVVAARSNTGRGHQRSDLPPCRSDRDLVQAAGAVVGWTDAVADVATIAPGVGAFRRADLEAAHGMAEPADPLPWTSLLRAAGLRLVVADGLYTHQQHEGPVRLGSRPRSVAGSSDLLPLAVVVVGADAAATIGHVSSSLEGLVAERIWVDTGSTDATPLLARALGWTVVPARTDRPALAAGAARARSPWVVALRPDEVLVVRDAAALAAELDALDGSVELAVQAPASAIAYGPLRGRRPEIRLLPRSVALDAMPVEGTARSEHLGVESLVRWSDVDGVRLARRLAQRLALEPSACSPGDVLDVADALLALSLPGPALDAAVAVLDHAPAGSSAATAAGRLALRAGLAAGDVAAVDLLLATVRSGDDVADEVRAATERALADRATGAAGAWQRLVGLASTWGPAFPRWDVFVTSRPVTVTPSEVAQLAHESRALDQLLDAVAVAAPRELVAWLRAVCGVLPPAAQHQVVAIGMLGVGPDGQGLRGLGVEAVLEAAADAVRRRAVRARRRRSDFDRAATILVVADGGVATCLAWLESLVELELDGRCELVVVDNGTRDDTAGLLACLEGDVSVLRLPVRATTGHALLEGATLVRGRRALVTSTVHPLNPAAIAALLDSAVGAGVRPLHGASDGTHLIAPGDLLHELGVLDRDARSIPALCASTRSARDAALRSRPEVAIPSEDPATHTQDEVSA
jgi:O-antigen biosynthesis protein